MTIPISVEPNVLFHSLLLFGCPACDQRMRTRNLREHVRIRRYLRAA